jgi:endoglucanase
MIRQALRLALAVLPLGAAAAHAGMLRGVNLSGAELGTGALPGRAGTDYVYPDAATLRYFAGAGMNVVRLPVLWERLQPSLGGALDSAETGRVDTVVAEAQKLHLRVIVDVHDYGLYRGQKIGGAAVPAAAFADFWAAMARHFDAQNAGGSVIFGLMNEPHDIAAQDWAASQQAAIDAIRATGSRNLVLVSGVGWDGAHNFTTGDGYGLANAQALQNLHDPADNTAIEVHQYLDGNFSGTSADCMAPDAARATLAPVTEWLRAQHRRGFLGEFAAAKSPSCLASLNALLGVLDAHPDVWLGWTYWAAGPWWGDYMFSVQPRDGADAPQMAVLRRHLPTPAGAGVAP